MGGRVIHKEGEVGRAEGSKGKEERYGPREWKANDDRGRGSEDCESDDFWLAVEAVEIVERSRRRNRSGRGLATERAKDGRFSSLLLGYNQFTARKRR